jgi:hypothetical protein
VVLRPQRSALPVARDAESEAAVAQISMIASSGSSKSKGHFQIKLEGDRTGGSGADSRPGFARVDRSRAGERRAKDGLRRAGVGWAPR